VKTDLNVQIYIRYPMQKNSYIYKIYNIIYKYIKNKFKGDKRVKETYQRYIGQTN